MADIQVANTDADLSDNTLLTEENAYTITGLHTFSRSTNAPFACISGAGVVAYLDSDKLDGQEGAYYLAAANVTGTLAVGKGGTGATSLTDGGVLLGSGTSAITAMAVLSDGEMIVGDGTTDPVAESGATLRTSIGVGTGDSPQFTGVELGHASDTTLTRASAGNVNIEGNLVYRAGGTDVPVSDGGTGASSFTDGGVLLGSGTSAITATAVLGDGEILIGDASGDPTTLDVGSSTAITILGTIATGVWQGTDIGVAYGGTGVSSLTDGGLLVGSGSSAITALGVAANGEIPIGDGSGDPQLATISGTSNEIEITNGSASIQVGIVTNPTLGVSNFTGTLANARLPTNVDLGGTLDVTGATTLDDDLSVGATDLFVDDSDARVGMGTAAPDKRLHIMESEVSGMAGNANSVVVIEEDANVTWIEFMNPAAATDVGLLWSDPGGNPGALNYNHDTDRMIFSAAQGFNFNNDVAISGALSKSSGSFKIDHPLPSKTETHHLVHSFLEGPQCDLIYRGTATLSSGEAEVNLDTASGMTEGTWVLLCRNEQCFTSNETGWTSVRGSVTGNILTIECEDGTSTDTISWMVVAERQDTHILGASWTDEDGHPILEPEKPEEP